MGALPPAGKDSRDSICKQWKTIKPELQKSKLGGQKEQESEKILVAGAHANGPLDTVALVRVASVGGGLSMPFRELISE